MRMQYLAIRKPKFYYLLLAKAVLQTTAKAHFVSQLASGLSMFFISESFLKCWG